MSFMVPVIQDKLTFKQLALYWTEFGSLSWTLSKKGFNYARMRFPPKYEEFVEWFIAALRRDLRITIARKTSKRYIRLELRKDQFIKMRKGISPNIPPQFYYKILNESELKRQKNGK